MKVLVTGAQGFLGQHLCVALNEISSSRQLLDKHNAEELTIYKYGRANTASELYEFCRDCSFVFNLAGVNRPKDSSEYMHGNFGFSKILLDTLERHGNRCPVMLASSIQASLVGRYSNSEYGRSKRAGEELFFEYGAQTGASTLVYRFPNIFGKWCRPNYNSVIATFCYNAAHGLPMQIHDAEASLDVVYINDVVDELLRALTGQATRDGRFCKVPIVYQTRLGRIAELLQDFQEYGKKPSSFSEDSFEWKLYETFASYMRGETIPPS